MNSLLARLVLVVVVALVPILAFHAYSENEAHHVRRQLVEDEALRVVQLISAEQQRIIEGAEQALDVLDDAPSVQDNTPALCQRMLSNFLAHAPRYSNLVVIGLDGRIVCAPNTFDIGIDVSDRPYFQRALRTGGAIVGEYSIGRHSGEAIIPISKQLRNNTGTVAGVVAVFLDLDWLGQQLDRLPLPKGAAARIADHNGIVLAHRPEGERYVGKPIRTENRFSLEGNEAGVRTARIIGGSQTIMAYVPPGLNRFAVGVALDPAATFPRLAQADRIGFFSVLVGGLLALALTVLLGNRLIRRPVAQLLDAAASWRTGALAVRTNLRKDDGEFGRLGSAFDDMAEALETRERAVRAALESTTDAVMVVDRSWHFTYLNEHARTLIGGRDPVGESFWEIFPDLEQADFGIRGRAAMASGLPAKIETCCDRLQKQFEIDAFPSDAGLTLYARDVTEARRVASALQETETRLQLVRDAAGFGVWDRDLASGVAVWSDQEWRLSGNEPRPGGPDLATWASMVHPEDRERVVAARTNAVIDPGQPYSSEHRVVWPNGEVHWLLSRAIVVCGATGAAVRIVGISLDVTESRKTEAALHDSEIRLRLAQEAAGFGMWNHDIVEGTMVWSNELWRLFGREPQSGAPDMVTWLSWFHPEDREPLDAGRTAALNDTSMHYHCEFRAVWPNGAIRWLQSKALITRGPNAKAVRVVGLMFDVTESRESEVALRRLAGDLAERVAQEVVAREAAQTRAAQAERMQALGQLAGGIAHDFNNILQAVSGAMTMIQRRPGDGPAIIRLAGLANEAIERGTSITRRLLTFGRSGDLHVEALDVPALLQGLQEMLIHTLGTGIEVSVRLGAALPPVMADKRQLETVLVNLATNARDAMIGGGRLVLSAETETLAASGSPQAAGLAPGSYVRLTVADTGAGMDAQLLARAREPFFTTKKLGSGTGLGLALAENFAEQSGGGLSLESREGEGTTVRLWLPRAYVEVTEGMPAPDDGVTKSARRADSSPLVLVVDDEATIREVIGDFLGTAGYRVLLAANGAEALRLLQSEQPVHALISDLSMPGLDGFTLIRTAQERYPDMPAILLTGYAGDDAALALGRSIKGTVSLLRKPVTDVQLLDRLSAMLSVVRDDARQTIAPEPAAV